MFHVFAHFRQKSLYGEQRQFLEFGKSTVEKVSPVENAIHLTK